MKRGRASRIAKGDARWHGPSECSQLRSARAGRIGSVARGAGGGLIVPAGAGMVDAAGAWGEVPVVPMGPPTGFCCPAAVAGFGGTVVGGVPWATAMLAVAPMAMPYNTTSGWMVSC